MTLDDSYILFPLSALTDILNEKGIEHKETVDQCSVSDRDLITLCCKYGTLSVWMSYQGKDYILDLWMYDESHFIAEYNFQIWLRHAIKTVYGI